MAELIKDKDLGFLDNRLNQRVLIPLFKRFVGVDKVNSLYGSLSDKQDALSFCKGALDEISLKLRFLGDDLSSNIPSQGAAVIVSNFPHGAIDLLSILYVALQVRSDVKVVASPLLQNIEQFKDHILPFDFSSAATKNSFTHSYRMAKEFVQSGGVLIVFPAIKVSSLGRNSKGVESISWNSKIVKFLYSNPTPIIPLFIYGMNSNRYRLLEAISPKLAELRLAKEFFNKKYYTLSVVVGRLITLDTLSTIDSYEELVRLLKANIRLLRRVFEQESSFLLNHSANDLSTSSKALSIRYDNAISMVSKCFFDKGSSSATLLLSRDDIKVYLFDIAQYAELMEIFAPKIQLYEQNEIRKRESEAEFSSAEQKSSDSKIKAKVFENQLNLSVAVEHKLLSLSHTHLLVLVDSLGSSIEAVVSVGDGAEIVSKVGMDGFDAFRCFEAEKEINRRLASSLELGSFIYSSSSKFDDSYLAESLLVGAEQYMKQLADYRYCFVTLSLCRSDSKIAKQLLVNYIHGHVMGKSDKKRGLVRPRRSIQELYSSLFEPAVMRVLDSWQVVESFINDIDSSLLPLPAQYSTLLAHGARLESLGYGDIDGRSSISAFLMLDNSL